MANRGSIMRIIMMALALLAMPAFAADPGTQATSPSLALPSEPSLRFDPAVPTPLTDWFAKDRSLSRAFRSDSIRREGVASADRRTQNAESAMRENRMDAQRHRQQMMRERLLNPPRY